MCPPRAFGILYLCYTHVRLDHFSLPAKAATRLARRRAYYTAGTYNNRAKTHHTDSRSSLTWLRYKYIPGKLYTWYIYRLLDVQTDAICFPLPAAEHTHLLAGNKQHQHCCRTYTSVYPRVSLFPKCHEVVDPSSRRARCVHTYSLPHCNPIGCAHCTLLNQQYYHKQTVLLSRFALRTAGTQAHSTQGSLDFEF